MWDARASIVPLHVAVSPDCSDSQNLPFITVLVPLAVGTACDYLANGFGPFTPSCANAASSTGIENLCSTPPTSPD